MKNKPERISCILSILANRVGESISALASEIGVSDMTIRRDLHELSAQGYTTVINGVAILNDNQDGSKIKKDYFIHDERQSMSGSKEAIGLEACKLIEPNDIVLIDTGSTTECMLKHLNLDFPITVVGYTLNTMVACQNRSNISLICGGGFYHRNTELFDSPEGVALISRLNINKCFMAAAGVTSKGNLSCIEPYEFMYKKHGQQHAQHRAERAQAALAAAHLPRQSTCDPVRTVLRRGRTGRQAAPQLRILRPAGRAGVHVRLERRTAVGAAAAVQIERQQIRRHAAGDRVHVDPSIRSMILFLARKYVTFAHDSDLPKMSAMSRKLSSPSLRSKNTSLYCAPSSCTWR